MARLFKRAPWRAPMGRTLQGKFIPSKFNPDVTLALTGASSTMSAGTLVANVAYAATGSEATVSAGTVTNVASYGLSGQSVTASAGTLVSNISNALSGQASTISAGTLVASPSYALSGQSITSSDGTLVSNVSYGLSGSSSTIDTGTVTAVGGDAGNVTKALTGEAVTVSAGTLVSNVSYSTTGQEATVSAGTLVAGVEHALSGESLASATGTLTVNSDVTIALTGEQITVSQGTLTASGGVAVASMQGGGIPDRLRRRDKPRKVLVTIDGEDFEVRNEEEAVALLEKASQEAESLANAQAERVVVLRQKRAKRYGDLNTSPIKLDVPQIEVTQTDSERSLTELIDRFQQEIDRKYREAAEKAEIALLVRNKVELDNDEATALLLLM